MGAVHAASAKLSKTEYTDTPVGCIPCPEGDNRPGNPGSLEDIHKKTKDLYPRNFEGAKLVVKKNLSTHFNATHTIALSSMTPSGYKFGCWYAGNKRVGPKERYPMAAGDIMPNGNLSATVMHTFGCRLRVKYSAQVAKNKFMTSSSTVEYRTDDLTSSLTLANPNFFTTHGTLVLHLLQSISNRIALGAEIACHRGNTIPGGQQTIMALALRYSTGYRTLSATFGGAAIHICYHHQASRQLQLGVEIETNLKNHESTATLVYQVDIPDTDLIFRGLVNSESTVAAVLEKKLYPIPESSLVISGLLNHAKQKFRVGIGLNIG